MNIDQNRLASYCFLAALTENQNDLFNHVYVPICKRALSLYSLKGATHGKCSDIQQLIRDEYGIDVPQVMVRKLIKATFKSLSNRSKKTYRFKIFQNGELFEMQKYTFSDLEIHYKKGLRNANAIQEAFIEYLKSENIENIELLSFADFLNKNKKHIAAFFKNSDNINGNGIDSIFIHHVQFLEYIDTSRHELFEIAKDLYLGSIVASFLESGIDLEPKFESNEVYFLDTPIVLRALDLQKEEETEPIRELLDLIKSTGGAIKILSITIEEIYKVIENAIGNYNNTTPTSTINEACIRLEKNKAWLINYNGKIETNILKTLKIEKVDILAAFIEKNQNSPDVKALQENRMRKGNALHDVLSYLFVRQLRGSSIALFQKAKAWFISNNTELLRFNKEHNPNSGITEIILPDALTSLLWLKSPNKLIENVKKVGLSELMATTLNEEISSKEIIQEFESNINSIEGISEEEYRTLLESVAHQSAKKIEHFNELAFKDKEKAKIEAYKIVDWERSRKAKRIKAIKDAQQAKSDEEKRNRSLQEKLSQIEQDLANSKSSTEESQTQIEKLSEAVIQQGKLIKRIVWLILGTVILGTISLIGFYFYESLNFIVKIFNWIMSAGALFGLGNLILNSLRFFGKKDK